MQAVCWQSSGADWSVIFYSWAVSDHNPVGIKYVHVSKIYTLSTFTQMFTLPTLTAGGRMLKTSALNSSSVWLFYTGIVFAILPSFGGEYHQEWQLDCPAEVSNSSSGGARHKYNGGEKLAIQESRITKSCTSSDRHSVFYRTQLTF